MTSSEFKDSLQEIASRYHIGGMLDDKIYDQMFHHDLAEKISKHLAPGIRVLELGYGEGTVSAETFSRFSTERHIVEGAGDLAQKAALDLGNLVKVHNCLFSDFVPEEKFDLVLATNVFEHVEDTSELFQSIRDWLSEDGICIITVPNSESFHRKIAVEMDLQESTKTLSARDEIVGHLRVYDLAQITDEVRQNGFKINRIEGMVLKFLSNSLQKQVPIEVISALHKVAHQYPPEYSANLYLEVVCA
jgi:cyclopropane fatty-acyl-phospholipid synthase-like methyltransferase